MAKRKVGLALSGGAARGMAHIGILEVLEREGIPIDMVAGTSAGAVIGALYAQGKDSSYIKNQAIELSRKRLTTFIDPSLPRSGFIRGDRIKELLAGAIGGNTAFSDLKMPFACVATDIETGDEVVLAQGSVIEAVRASISIPAIFTAVRWGNRYLVDGGLVNPVPVNLLQQMGADFIIAVNVIPDVTDRTQRVKKEPRGNVKEPNIIHVLMQAIYIGTYALARISTEMADILIEPQVAHIGAGDFHHIPELIHQGEMAAEKAIPEIKRRLKVG